MPHGTYRFVFIALAVVIGAISHVETVDATPIASVLMVEEEETRTTTGSVPNGSFETWTEKGPTSWFGVLPAGSKVRKEENQPYVGKASAVIDTTDDAVKHDSFSNLMQVISADAFRGKKVRLRASIKTDHLEENCRVQMWLRVDIKKDPNQPANSVAQFGAFDNMDGRPIRTEEWKHFDIVLPVAEHAENLALGIFVIGKGQAWIDDLTLEIVEPNTPVTAKATPQAATKGYQIPPKVAEAIQGADKAPRQPFLTHWLWLPIIAGVLFVVGMLGPLPAERTTSVADTTVRNQSLWATFAIRFTAAYWFFYCFPAILAEFSREPSGIVARTYAVALGLQSSLTYWIARTFFAIEGELVPPNGSGDTTFNYLQVLGMFLVSLILGGLWTVADRRTTNNSATRDLLRSLLRYTIAFAMIGYGLAKFGFEGTQFGTLSTYQLDKTWGDSSPMNVLWAFMATSQAYTMFAGFGEILAGLLIVWRRTALLGAAVSLGVMTNVLMLNISYDVPVKLYSSHLVMASILVLMPDAERLINIFLLNRPTAKVCLGGIWQRPWLWWTRLVLKIVVISLFVLMPVGTRVISLPGQWTNFVAATKEAESSKYRIQNRGFRWINEVPYNR